MKKESNIERLFKQNQQGLDEVPGSQVWEKIEVQLEANKIKKSFKKWYFIAASVIVLVTSIAIFIFNSLQQTLKNLPQPIVSAPTSISSEPANNELTQENISEVLDEATVKQQSIATLEKKALSISVIKNNKLKEPIKEVTPSISSSINYKEADLLENKEVDLMITNKVELSASLEEAPIAGVEVSSSINSSLNKKKQNVSTDLLATPILEERARVNNSTPPNTKYISKQPIKQLVINKKSKQLLYQLTSKNDSSVIFTNYQVPYPQQIIFKNSNVKDSIQIIYQGDYSQRESIESKEIQEYIKLNQYQILKEIQAEE